MELELNKIHNIDCLEFMKTLPDKCIDLVVTDPPYGVSWKSNRRKVKHELIKDDDNVDWVLPVFTEIYRVMKDDSVCFSFYGWPDADVFVSSWKKVGLVPKSHIVFKKNNMGLGWFTRGQHESGYLLTKGNPPKPQVAMSDVQDWIGTGNNLHPTQKPVDVIAKIIGSFSKEGDLVFDPFMGSATTAVASKMLKRNYIGCEISKEYCDIAESRIKSISNTLF
jgi:adenine-specific DNA-methyltransferase